MLASLWPMCHLRPRGVREGTPLKPLKQSPGHSAYPEGATHAWHSGCCRSSPWANWTRRGDGTASYKILLYPCEACTRNASRRSQWPRCRSNTSPGCLEPPRCPAARSRSRAAAVPGTAAREAGLPHPHPPVTKARCARPRSRAPQQCRSRCHQSRGFSRPPHPLPQRHPEAPVGPD